MHHDREEHEEEFSGQLGDIRLWRHMLGFMRPMKRWIALAVFLSFIITATSLFLPYLVQQAMDKYIVSGNLTAEERFSGLSGLSAVFLMVVLLGFVTNFFQVVVLEWTGQTIMHALRQKLFQHVLNLNLSFFHGNPVGRIVTRLTNDIQNMYEMFTSVIVTLFNDGVRIVGILGILFWMNQALALLLCLTFPAMVLITLWFGRLSRKAFRQIRRQLAAMNAFIQEAVTGISVIQMFLRQKDTHRRFSFLNEDYRVSAFYQIRVFGIFVPLIEVMSSVSLALVVWYGGGEILRQTMTIGVLTAFISYIRLFFQPIRELSQKYTIVQSAMASAERIFGLLENRDVLTTAEHPQVPSQLAGEVEFRDVTFAYDGENPVIRDLSFRVKPGETLAIVGATGAGKTTVISLLERFYDPGQGAVTLDGVDVRLLDPLWLRRQIGLVMQDVFIVPGTLRENILLGREASDNEVGRLVELSQLSRVVRQFPDGLETRIGEGAMDLSAGQKQLLAFARVLARDPRILILDEATANVDTETEMLIEQAIEVALAKRTSIVIAHRLSTIRRANRILVMDHGSIVEEGTHDELMARRGLYFHLQTLQNGGSAEVPPQESQRVSPYLP
ncbi:MAG: ABC transporter ATP-binding protein [Deltaproteobacteria bacterium]|nr:ABC transporter ATP-binding protein [Deltaproteobacteria bacterium]